MQGNQPKRCVCVIARHLLAGEYLVQLLREDQSLQAVLREGLPEAAATPATTIFVIERAFILLPVSECIRRLRSRFVQGRFIVVDGPLSENEMVVLVRVGVHGFVEHCNVSKTLRDAVQTVAEGRLWIPSKTLQAYIQSSTRTNGRGLSMTPREDQVLELVKGQLSNKEIAAILKIEESTVKFHVSSIFGKLHVTNRQELDPQRKLLAKWGEL